MESKSLGETPREHCFYIAPQEIQWKANFGSQRVKGFF